MRRGIVLAALSFVVAFSACGGSGKHAASPFAPVTGDPTLVPARYQKCATLGKVVVGYLSSGKTSNDPLLDHDYASQRTKILSKPTGARAALARTDADTAIRSCDKSQAAAVTALISKALKDYAKGNTARAKGEFEQAVKEDPEQKYAWFDLGVIAQAAKNDNEAGDDYKNAVALDPNFESALYNYGLMRSQANDLPTAIAYLSRAVAVDPNDANAHWNLGLALSKANTPADNARATIEINKALKLNPKLGKTITGGANLP